MIVAVSQFVSHYDVLGVTPHATHDEIRRAYRALAQVHHPDANPDGANATMVGINAAWDVLGDPDKRREYDRAIGTPPAFKVWVYEDDIDEDDDPLAHLRDDPDASPPRRRASDLLLFIPVMLLLTAVATFAFSVLSEAAGLRTMAILLAPVTAASFLAAPLFMMMRARSRDS
jgi:hypothetical protein